jgi:predicted membrane protein (TIGR00267 family)
VIGVLIPVLPFLFEGLFLTMFQATVASVALAVLLLGAFGAYMAKISRQRMLWAAARMGLAGLVVAFLNIILPG